MQAAFEEKLKSLNKKHNRKLDFDRLAIPKRRYVSNVKLNPQLETLFTRSIDQVSDYPR